MSAKLESRIIPEATSRSLYIQHLKAYEFISRKVRDKYVLDVGCGDGYGAAFLARSAKSVIGIDYDQAVILTASQKYKADNLKYMYMDATKIKLDGNKFDFVCSFQVIEHIPENNHISYLNELKRMLKLRGELYISTLNLDKAMKDSLNYKKNSAHCKEFKLEELRCLLSRVFDVFDIYGLHPSQKQLLHLILKKSGILKAIPDSINPVSRFYRNISLDDFRINNFNLKKASDFICLCRN